MNEMVIRLISAVEDKLIYVRIFTKTEVLLTLWSFAAGMALVLLLHA